MGAGVPTTPEGVLEQLREEQTGDDKFFRRMPPVFELQVPARATRGAGTSFLFPLPMPPRAIEVEYPFAVEVTPTMGGGVVVEENGVVTVQIRIQGTMGQKIKPYKGSYFGLISPPNKKLSDKPVVARTMQGMDISAHRYLLHLRDAVFGTYSDLKEDDELASETRMILHIPKDDEHYVVVPKSFRVPRDASRKMIWDYEILLEGVAVANAELVSAPEDKPILAQLLDAVTAVRSAVRLVQATVRDLSKIRTEIANVASEIVGVIDDVAAVFEEVSDFIDGTKDAISACRSRIDSAIDRLETAMERLDPSVSDDTAHLCLELNDSMHEVLAHADLFEPSPDVVVAAAFRRGLGLLADTSQSALTAASSADPPASQSALRSTGTLPSDAVRDQRARSLPEEFKQYRSAYEAIVDEDDTLELIASREMGDARRWRHIAILNALQHPYVSRSGLPNTLEGGARILIPSTAAPAPRTANPAVYGARPDDPTEVRALGSDWLVTVDPVSELEDWTIDLDGGSVDLRVASGVACLVQDLTAVMETERGSDALYANFGIREVIGFGLPLIEIDAQRLRTIEALESDPRVERVADVTISGQGDTIERVARVAIKGLREPVTIQGSTAPPSGP